jgi:hypothetical protein
MRSEGRRMTRGEEAQEVMRVWGGGGSIKRGGIKGRKD